MLLSVLEELVGVQELQLKLNTTEEEKRIIKEQLKKAQVSRLATQTIHITVCLQEAAQVEIQQLKKEVEKVMWNFIWP